MAKRVFLILACVGLCACSSASATPVESTIAIVATTPALENLALDWIADYPTQGESRIEIRILAPLAVADAIEGDTVDLAITGGEPPDDVFVTPLYEEGIAVVVNPKNDIQSVSLETLEGLFDGRITNWSELNGDDLAVQAVIPFSADEIRIHFEHTVISPRSESGGDDPACRGETGGYRLPSILWSHG